MNPKRLIIVGTVALVVTIGGKIWNDETKAVVSLSFSPVGHFVVSKANETAQADLTQVLGVSSDEEIYDALYNGKSLANIAEDNHADVQNVIDLQVAELTVQLTNRLDNGSISPTEYQLQKSELPEIITKSVYTAMDT
jgi:hypothetical protein